MSARPPEPASFDPVAIIAALCRHQVEFVLIGGVAATLHGSSQATFDLDLVYRATDTNLRRLSAALEELGAVRVTDPDDPSPPSADSLTQRVEAFISPVGRVDVFRTARSVGGYDALIGSALTLEIDPQVTVRVASLESIIWSKSGTGRAKDAEHVRSLERLREELEASPD